MTSKLPSLLGRGKKPKTTSASRLSPQRQPQGTRSRVAFAALIVAAIVALALFVTMRVSGQLSIAENAVGTILSPIQRALSGVTVYVRDLVNGAKDYMRMTEEVAQLQMELTNVKVAQSQSQAKALEADQLRALLGAKDTYGDRNPIYADVIGKSSDVWFNTFSINVGANDRVRAGHAVITGDGLVGRVFEVGATYAKVMSIINEDSAVGCIIERTRDNGVMHGPVSRNTEVIECELRRLTQIDAVVSGDVVITSGTDKVYPKGIPVGTVTQVSRLQSDVSDRFVYVRPAVDFLRIEHVLVLRVEVEQDEGEYAPLLTPIPTATPIPTIRPTPTPNSDAVIPGLNEPFSYPEGTVNADGEFIESPSSGSSAQGGRDNISFIESEWAR